MFSRKNFQKGNKVKQVKSKYIIKIIFGNLKENIFLGLMKYNKDLQNKLDINITNYKLYCQPLAIKEFKTNPKDIITQNNNFINGVDDSQTFSHNVFIIFKALDNIYYLVYISGSNSIVSFDLINNRTKKEKKQNKDVCTACLSYIQDNYKKRDLIMSIEPGSNSLKVWNFSNFDLIYDFQKINKYGYLNTANFFSYDNNIYIMTSNHRFSAKNVDPVKIYDLKGKKIKELKESNENVSFVDSYHDKKSDKKYIIVAFSRYIKAYNFKENTIYKVFKDKYNPYLRNILINDNDDKITKLIETSTDKYLRIWDFHNANLIKRIQVNKENKKEVYGFCLWNNENIFVGVDHKILLININTGDIISEIEYNSNEYSASVIAVKKFIHPKYGECLITKSQQEKKIRMWTRKK